MRIRVFGMQQQTFAYEHPEAERWPGYDVRNDSTYLEAERGPAYDVGNDSTYLEAARGTSYREGGQEEALRFSVKNFHMSVG